MVENMSGFICPDTGKRYDIFGRGGAERKAREMDVPFLGELPINIGIREKGDRGETSRVFDDPTTSSYLETITRNLALNLAERSKGDPPLPTLSVL
jgi:ATP-binding protein involved in chromosome partitioning